MVGICQDDLHRLLGAPGKVRVQPKVTERGAGGNLVMVNHWPKIHSKDIVTVMDGSQEVRICAKMWCLRLSPALSRLACWQIALISRGDNWLSWLTNDSRPSVSDARRTVCFTDKEAQIGRIASPKGIRHRSR